MSHFHDLNVHPELLLALSAQSWVVPTAVQRQAIPPALAEEKFKWPSSADELLSLSSEQINCKRR